MRSSRSPGNLSNERQGFQPFVYEAEGRRRLPFFTTNEHAQTFVGEYSRQRNRVYSFQVLTVKGSLLAELWPACDVLVMNDGSGDELELADQDVKAFRRTWVKMRTLRTDGSFMLPVSRAIQRAARSGLRQPTERSPSESDGMTGTAHARCRDRLCSPGRLDLVIARNSEQLA